MKKLKPYIILNVILFMYSFGGIFSKTAANEEFLSLKWCLLYGGLIFILGIYALLWQKVLKMLPLNIAYANKAVTLIWSMMWGVLVFKETISLSNIIGGIIVIAGVILMVTGEEKKHE